VLVLIVSSFLRIAGQAARFFRSANPKTDTVSESDLGEFLHAAVRKFRVPGASIALVQRGRRSSAQAGVLSLDTNLGVTRDAPFLIGSVSKIWTATLVMQLVEEGSLELDDLVCRYVPELVLADPESTERLTIRHLLTHTAGLEDDFMIAWGDRGDGCIGRYVGRLKDLGVLHPPGAMYSYCNSGFVLAGRLLECLHGGTFENIVRERIVQPLGLSDTVLFPEEALLRRSAVGHVPDTRNRLGVAPIWSLPRAFGPAGATIAASASDLLTFAQMHISRGRTIQSNALLTIGSIREMQTPQVPLPGVVDPSIGAAGLGWMTTERDGLRILYHGGLNVGQHCGLVVVPEHELAIVSLTNSVHGAALQTAIFRHLLRDRFGIPPASPQRATSDGVGAADPAQVVGEYRRLDTHVKVSESDHVLQCQVTKTSPVYQYYGHDASGSTAGAPHRLRPIADWTFSLMMPGKRRDEEERVVFVDTDGDGTADYVYIGLAAARRVIAEV
jgi:CubicO group peptidase (beta-lactamase class C family)